MMIFYRFIIEGGGLVVAGALVCMQLEVRESGDWILDSRRLTWGWVWGRLGHGHVKWGQEREKGHTHPHTTVFFQPSLSVFHSFLRRDRLRKARSGSEDGAEARKSATHVSMQCPIWHLKSGVSYSYLNKWVAFVAAVTIYDKKRIFFFLFDSRLFADPTAEVPVADHVGFSLIARKRTVLAHKVMTIKWTVVRIIALALHNFHGSHSFIQDRTRHLSKVS